MEKMTIDDECAICLEEKNNPVKTKCGHIYCKKCIKAYISSEKSDFKLCPICRQWMGSFDRFSLFSSGLEGKIDFEPPEIFSLPSIFRNRNHVTLNIKYGSVNKLWRKNRMSYLHSEKINTYKVFVECKLDEGLLSQDIPRLDHYKYVESISMIPSKPFEQFSVYKCSPPFTFFFSTDKIKSVTIIIKLNVSWPDHPTRLWNCVENENTLTLKHDIDLEAPFKEEHLTHEFIPGPLIRQEVGHRRRFPRLL